MAEDIPSVEETRTSLLAEFEKLGRTAAFKGDETSLYLGDEEARLYVNQKHKYGRPTGTIEVRLMGVPDIQFRTVKKRRRCWEATAAKPLPFKKIAQTVLEYMDYKASVAAERVAREAEYEASKAIETTVKSQLGEIPPGVDVAVTHDGQAVSLNMWWLDVKTARVMLKALRNHRKATQKG